MGSAWPAHQHIELPLSLSLSLHSFSFSSPSRPGREEGKTVRGWDGGQKLLSANSFSLSLLLFPLSLLLPNFFFYALSFGLFLCDRYSFTARQGVKAKLSVTHTHSDTHSDTHSHPPLSFSATPSATQSRGKVTPSLCHPAAVSFPQRYDWTYFYPRRVFSARPCVCVFLLWWSGKFFGWASGDKDQSVTGMRVHLTLGFQFEVSSQSSHIL